MKWVYLSPHLDDAVYSCGGLIHQQVRQGIAVEIWTIFAGSAAPQTYAPFARAIHQRWGTGDDSSAARRREDAAACARLGAQAVQLDFLDVIYRLDADSQQPCIQQDADLFQSPQAQDSALRQAICLTLQEHLPLADLNAICVPLGLGGHIDHLLVRQAAEFTTPPDLRAYYADFPYVLQGHAQPQLPRQQLFPLNEEDLAAWGDAMALYASQMSTFWADETEMRSDLQTYNHKEGGSRLWFTEQ